MPRAEVTLSGEKKMFFGAPPVRPWSRMASKRSTAKAPLALATAATSASRTDDTSASWVKGNGRAGKGKDKGRRMGKDKGVGKGRRMGKGRAGQEDGQGQGRAGGWVGPQDECVSGP